MRETLTVRVKHRASRPHTYWVEPVGWEPDVSGFGTDAFWDGAVWEEQGEVAGMAACCAGLGTDSPEEGEELEVRLADLFWLSAGDCRNVGGVEVLK